MREIDYDRLYSNYIEQLENFDDSAEFLAEDAIARIEQYLRLKSDDELYGRSAVEVVALFALKKLLDK